MRAAHAFHRIWQIYAGVAGLILFAGLFAAGLGWVSAGQGAVIVIDGPPQGAFLRADSSYGQDRLRLRVPVGGDLVFDSMWHTAKGGCERSITSTLAQGDEREAFILTQRRRGEFFAVGQPGRHHIVRKLPAGALPGLWRYRAEGVAICPTRTLPPVPYADFDVEIYDPDGPAQIGHGVTLITSTVSAGEPLRYRESFERTDDTPSIILLTFTSVADRPEVVVARRMGALTRPGVFRDVNISEPLPPEIHPGRWRLSKTALSTRQDGKTRVDHLFDVEFEVRP